MSATFSQIYIHVIFAVKARDFALQHSWEEELYMYIAGIVRNKGQKMLAINGMPDHIHILIGMKPSCCLSDLVREIKKSSGEFIRKHKRTAFKFQWQEGYAAFSCSHSALEKVISYISNQKKHHQRRSFREEYRALLDRYEVDYSVDFLFDF